MGYRFSLGYQRADTLPGRDEAALRVDVPDLGIEVYRGNGLIEYSPSPGRRMGLSGGISDLPRYDGPRTRSGWGIADIRFGYLQLRYEGSQALFQGYWNSFDIKRKDYIAGIKRVPRVEDTEMESDLYNLEWQYRWPIGRSHQVIGGINYRVIDAGGAELKNPDLRPLSTIGFFLQDEWRPLEKVGLVYGARYDRHVTLDDAFLSPRIAILYHPFPRQTLRLSAGVVYRSSTPAELFRDLWVTPEFMPEKVVTYEAGYSLLLPGRIKGDINLFYNRLTDQIDSQLRISANSYNGSIYGGEIGVERPMTSWTTVFMNYAYQEVPKFSGQISDRNGSEHKVNGGIHVQFPQGLSTNLPVDHCCFCPRPIPHRLIRRRGSEYSRR